MARTSAFGLGLALAGALILTPDALLMRVSGMDGFQMLGWRGMCMGVIFMAAWALTASNHRADLARLVGPTAALVILCHALNASLFPLGIAISPVAPVLLGVATVPVWSALLARLLHGEATSTATWVAITLVMAGLAYAVTDTGDAALDPASLIGAACGLGVALALALNFVTLRHHPDLPLLPVIGIGALIAGAAGWTLTGPAQMAQGHLWAILTASIVILPLSFFALSQASRYTAAANVSLLLLLETVLAPIWVWLGTGEAPSRRMVIGGTIVVLTLAVYVLRARRVRGLASRAPLPNTAPRQTTPDS
ncbi:EamA-like transporter family protein [Antarctobacter heliothermus]|uniref:EamA-like transporter family protein n=1 Tax=Antarctobacter heliothermus TaxID=74033 RepID=A0A222E5A0_9RHOB|nr:DMT family transporter [Antarctobacter heliothermus]ASP21394.1 EamA-like transporter family protein [Antarctobacter heliothermus]